MNKLTFPKTVIKRIIFVIMIFSAYLLQFIALPASEISLAISFLIPVGVAISMNDREIPDLLYGALTGALWDLASPVTDGSFSFIFALLLCISGLLTRYILRNTLLTAVIFTLILTAVTTAINITYFRNGMTAELLSDTLIKAVLPCLIINSLICIPTYYFCRYTAKHFHSDKN